MALVRLQVSSIINLGLWDKVCEYKGWSPWILNEGRITDGEWVEFDDTFEKGTKVEEVRFFITEEVVSSKWLLFEKDGDFYDHNSQDLLIATFEDKEYADLVCKKLNEMQGED